MKSPKRLLPTLRRLAELLAATSECLNELLERVEEEPEVSPATAAPSSKAYGGAPWSWNALVDLSVTLVQSKPDHRWSWLEFVGELQRHGVVLESWRGVNGRLVAELKKRGLVTADRRSFQAVSTKQRSQVGGLEQEHDIRDGEARDTSPPAAPPKGPGLELPWDELVRVATRALEDRVGERLTGAQLCQLLRDRGVQMATWKGVPIGLVGKLHGLRMVARSKDGSFVVLESVRPAAGHRNLDEPAEARPPSSPANADDDDLDGLTDEIAALTPYLDDLPQRQVTAQICVWVGRVRRLQDTLGNRPKEIARLLGQALRNIFRRLHALARQSRSGWVDALSLDWTTAWDAYITYNEAIATGTEPRLTREEEQAYYRDVLRGLLNPERRTASQDAQALVLAASPVLPENDAVLARVIERLGRPMDRRQEAKGPPPFLRRDDTIGSEEAPPTIERHVPEDVLARTRGKRALIAGGQGAREAHRRAIQESLGLSDVEWVTTERGKAAPFSRLEERMRPGRYDLVLFLASHSSHQSGGFIRACRSAQIPLVYLARGYSVNSVAQAIQHQLVAKRAPELAEPPVRAT